MLPLQRRKIVLFAVLLAGAGLLLWRWWPRPPLIFDHIDCIEPSPSGRYIALTGADAKNHVGLWLYTVRSQHWRFYPCLANDIQWLPDEQSVMLCHRTRAFEPNGDETHQFSFACLSLRNFQEKKYGRLTQARKWKLLPDGSGIVATRCVTLHHAYHTELMRCSFADGQWSCLFKSPASDDGSAGGNILCIYRYPDTISIVFDADSDSIDWWVDLSDGKAYACVMPDQLFQLSPDGEYGLMTSTDGIRKKPSRPHIVFTGESKHNMNILSLGTLAGKIGIPVADGETSYAWSPSGQMLAMATPTDKFFRPGDPLINTLRDYLARKLSIEISEPETDQQYHLLTSSGKEIGIGKGDHPQWIGNDLLLVVFSDDHLQKTVAQSEALSCYHYFLVTREGKIIRELFMANIMNP